MLTWGNQFGNYTWLACCFTPLHFGIVVEKYRAKLKWILQALLGIQRWNLMTLDLLIFWECSSVNLHANRGVGCGIDIQGKGSCPSTSQNISLGRITPSS
jgi:hypothetical protein